MLELSAQSVPSGKTRGVCSKTPFSQDTQLKYSAFFPRLSTFAAKSNYAESPVSSSSVLRFGSSRFCQFRPRIPPYPKLIPLSHQTSPPKRERDDGRPCWTTSQSSGHTLFSDCSDVHRSSWKFYGACTKRPVTLFNSMKKKPQKYSLSNPPSAYNSRLHQYP